MAIWSSEIKELERLYESIKGQSPGLEKELAQLIHFDDPNVIMLYSRRCLEVIITDLCECELKRERGTEPLKGIIDKLNKEKKVPSHIITSMHGLNDLSTYGTHPKNFDPEQVKPVLNNLDIIIKWYLKYKNIVKVDKTEVSEEKNRLRKGQLEEVTIKERAEVQEKPAKSGERKLISMVTIMAIFIIAAILAYPKIFKKHTLEKLRSSGERISVAVMPFQNLTNDTTWNKWKEVIQTNIASFLSNYDEELKIRQAELITKILQTNGQTDYGKITSSVAGSISQKLDADVFVNGNINQSSQAIRLNAQIVDSKTGEVLKSFQLDGTAERIIPLMDSLSIMLKDALIISELGKEFAPEVMRLWAVNSPEAFRYFKSGQNAFNGRDWAAATNFYTQALGIDSNYTFAAIMLSYSYLNRGIYDEAKKWCLKLSGRSDRMTVQEKIMISWLNAVCFEDPYAQIKYIKQLIEIDDQAPNFHFLLGMAYWDLNEYNKAIPEYEKALEIYDKLLLKPQYTGNYSHLLTNYYLTEQYDKMEKLLKKAENDLPDNSDLLFWHAVLLLYKGEITATGHYIDRYISVLKERSLSEASIMTGVAGIYSDADIHDKAEEYYLKALALEPENPLRLNNLAYFLIDKDRNVNEGQELVDRALELIPHNYEFMDTKGWGLYKQGKYQESLEILQKSWDLRREKAVYDHEAFLHLEAAKKAVGAMK